MLAGWQPGMFLIFSGPAAQQQEVAGDLLQSGGGGRGRGFVTQGGEKTEERGPVYDIDRGIRYFVFCLPRV